MIRKWLEWVDQIRCSWHRHTTALFLVALFLLSMNLPIAAQQATVPLTVSPTVSPIVSPTVTQAVIQTAQSGSDANTLDQQGRQRYEAAQYAEAIALWQQAIDIFAATGDRFGQAQTLSNLSLAHQQLGNWTDAEAAIQAALIVLNTSDLQPSSERSQLLAQAWDVQGRLQLSRGDIAKSGRANAGVAAPQHCRTGCTATVPDPGSTGLQLADSTRC